MRNSLLFLIIALFSISLASANVFIRGDANFDGVVDVSDSQYITNFLYRGGSAFLCRDAADANDDGRIDLSDSVKIFMVLFRGHIMPEPYPEYGPDLTPDNLDCNGGIVGITQDMIPFVITEGGTNENSKKYVLLEDISSGGSAITVNADNVILNGNGYELTYGSSGQSRNYGIYAENSENLEIMNFNLEQSNSGSNNHAIYIKNSPRTFIKDNTIITFGSNSFAIYLDSFSNNVEILNNNLETYGDYSSALRLHTSEQLSVFNNIISTFGRTGHGIYLFRTDNSDIRGNIIESFNFAGYGIHLVSDSSLNNIELNHILTEGDSAYGIYLYSSSLLNAIESNYIETFGDRGHGLYFSTDSSQNEIIGGAVKTHGLNSDGINLNLDSNLNSFNEVNIETFNSNAYPLHIVNGFHNTVLRDSILNSNNFDGEIKVESFVKGGEWMVINTTFNNASIANGAGGILKVYKYLDISARDESGFLENVRISGTDNNHNMVFSELTDVNGRVSRQELLSHTKTSRNFEKYTPYIIVAEISNHNAGKEVTDLSMSTLEFVLERI